MKAGTPEADGFPTRVEKEPPAPAQEPRNEGRHAQRNSAVRAVRDLRPRLRPLFIAERERRRLAVGEHLTLLFENGRTVWYQIEEMLRTERITAEDAIRHEIDTYNELLPRPGELTTTMLIEYPDTGERDVMLRRLNAASSLVALLIERLSGQPKCQNDSMMPPEN